MTTKCEHIGHFEQALAYRRNGYRLVIVRPGAKIPAFKGWQRAAYTDDELRRLLDEQDYNVGILTGGELVVLDIDSSEPAEVSWAVEHCGDTPMKCRTPGGGLHLYFRTQAGVRYSNGVKLQGGPYDMRWNGCFAVCPWSRNGEGIAYRWVGPVLPVADLPVLRAEPLLRKKASPKMHGRIPSVERTGPIRNVRAYIQRIASIQGSRGSDACFRVACILRDAGKAPDEALECMQEWNEKCAVPAWSVPELEKKIRDAYSKLAKGA
jgi:hypothetical protein